MPQPPLEENKALTWPYWPLKLRTSSSHLEGDTQRKFAIATKEFNKNGALASLKPRRARMEGRQDERSRR